MALVAGPGLADAEAEVSGLHERYPSAEVLTSSLASVARVAKAL